MQAAHPHLRQMATALQSKGLRVSTGQRRRAEAPHPAGCKARWALLRSASSSSVHTHSWNLLSLADCLLLSRLLPQLLGQGEGASWGPPGKLPAPGQYCYESLQMARYEPGQHFLAHEASVGAGGSGGGRRAPAACILCARCRGLYAQQQRPAPPLAGAGCRECLAARRCCHPPVRAALPCSCVQDGFPAGLARSNGFQRHATLLIYLNSTREVRACCWLGRVGVSEPISTQTGAFSCSLPSA